MSFFHPDAFALKKQAQLLVRPQNIAIAGLFTALYIVLSYFNIRISSVLEIRWPFLMLAASGMFGGPVMGLAVAVLSDVASTILSGAAFFPGFTISYSLMAFLFGLIFYKSRITVPRAVAGALVEFVISATLNTLWLSLMYGTPLQALFITRIVKCCVMFFVNAALLYTVLGAFTRVLSVLHLSVQE